MDTDFLHISIPTSIAILGLLILFFAVAIAIRNKSIGWGLGTMVLLLGVAILFLLIISPFIGFIGLLYLYNQHVPEHTQITIGWVAFWVGFEAFALFFTQYNNYRLQKAGGTVSPGRTKNAQLLRSVLTFLVIYCLLTMASDLFYGTNINESVRRNTAWWIIAIVLFIQSYFSFEFRQKGLVYRGKVILFSSIEHAECVRIMDKTELRIRLKGVNQVITIKTTREMDEPIQNYIKTNFPSP
jgi:hypothetical protein